MRLKVILRARKWRALSAWRWAGSYTGKRRTMSMPSFVTTAGRSFAGTTVVLDCAFGATYRVRTKSLRNWAPGQFPYIIRMTAPDQCPLRINPPRGSPGRGGPPGAQAGLLRRDGDRVIALMKRAKWLMATKWGICGLHLMADGRLPHNAIAVTVYSNLGLIETFQEAVPAGCDHRQRRSEGVTAMREKGLVLGGEQSGHVIFLEHNTRGWDSYFVTVDDGSPPGGATLSVLKKRIRKFPRSWRMSGWGRKRAGKRISGSRR